MSRQHIELNKAQPGYSRSWERPHDPGNVAARQVEVAFFWLEMEDY